MNLGGIGIVIFVATQTLTPGPSPLKGRGEITWPAYCRARLFAFPATSHRPLATNCPLVQLRRTLRRGVLGRLRSATIAPQKIAAAVASMTCE